VLATDYLDKFDTS